MSGDKVGVMDTDGPVLIDPRQFARARSHFAAIFPAASLSRLEDVLASSEGSVQVLVDGHLDAYDRPSLRVVIKGCVELACRRCLAPMAITVALGRELSFVEGLSEFEPSAEQEGDDRDVLPLVAQLDLRELLEEEILLTLPMAPSHGPGKCPNRVEVSSVRGDGTRVAVFSKLGEMLSAVPGGDAGDSGIREKKNAGD